jgi:hypothetical protein
MGIVICMIPIIGRRIILIKFTSTGKNTTLIGLGISEENVRRLKAAQPILIKGSELGFDWLEILIFYGKDEEELKKTVKATLAVDKLISKASEE